MADWSASVSRGWLDEGRTPAEVRRLVEDHAGQGKPAVLCVQAHDAATDPQSDVPFTEELPAQDGPERAFRAVWQFLSRLTDPRFDFVSVIFVNFQPTTSDASLSPRPEGFAQGAPSVVEGLRRFSRSVSESLHPTGSWSVCEWTMLSCTQQV